MIPIYVLCGLTSAMCALLLFRAFKQTGLRLLNSSGWCFVGLFFNHVLLVADVLIPEVRIASITGLPALAGVAILIHGMVRDSEL